MGERKGVNKYYPPDYDPSKGGLNKFQGTHALRERARKLHLGILIIRFEMPYNIWCEGCENHIGTGVRYNAEKKKVGMYYSTPIYQFRMKCHLCDNHFEIKTDPAALDYEIVSGARRQERRWDPTENEQIVPEDKTVTKKMITDSMFKLEHIVGDKAKSKERSEHIERLEEFQTRRWHDDYSTNKAMRDSMRVRRTQAKEQEIRDASYNLPVPLLPPNEDDLKTAKLLQFTQSKTTAQLLHEKRKTIDAQSVFAKFKTKSIPPAQKKAFARRSLEGIITNSQSSFSSSKDKDRHKRPNLGIVVKKTNELNSAHSSEDIVHLDANNVCSCGRQDLSTADFPNSSGVDASCILSNVDNCSCICKKRDGSAKASMLEQTCPDASAAVSTNRDTSASSSKSSTVDEPSLSLEKKKISSLVGYDFSGTDSD